MRLWSIYHENIPQFILDFAFTDAMIRLKNIGMNCGLEYTNFPLHNECKPYSRYDHSIGVALIIWHFTQDKKQTIAGLFHDISTPVFAHVIDFLNHDYLEQESTEKKTKELILKSDTIMELLEKHRMNVEEVCDYHLYPIADNDSPQLSADRLEYTIGNFVNYQIKTQQEAEEYYRNLTIIPNENGICEIAFRSRELACSFTEAALENSKVYVADADRFSMQYLADILRYAMAQGILLESDLYSTEPEVIDKLKHSSETALLWEKFCNFSTMHYKKENPNLPTWITISAKKRYINPLVSEYGRVTEISEKINRNIAEFLSYDFNYWIAAS
jgi:HD superfamily phosphohydrolase